VKVSGDKSDEFEVVNDKKAALCNSVLRHCVESIKKPDTVRFFMSYNLSAF